MLTKEEVLDVVGKVWWENNNIMMDFLHNHMTREGAKVFTKEHCHFAAHFPQWFGNIIGNCPSLEVRRYMIQNMTVEEVRDPMINEGHYNSLVKFGLALGLAKNEMINDEPTISMQMALNYWDNVTRTRPWLEAFSGIGGLEINLHRELATRYGDKPLISLEFWEPLGLSRDAMSHWIAADAADPDEGGHGDETIEFLCEYTKTEEQKRAVLATLKQSLSVFRYQYDQIGKAAIEASKGPL